MNRAESPAPHVPYFRRIAIESPSIPYGGIANQYQTGEMLRWATRHGILDPAEHAILYALYHKGGIKEFQGGRGIEFSQLKGDNYDCESMSPVIDKIALQVKPLTGIVMAPQNSGKQPGKHLADTLGVPFLELVKNGHDHNKDHLIAKIDSYTGKGVDVFTLDISAVQQLMQKARKHEGTVNVTVMDDFMDTGSIIELAEYFAQQLNERGIGVQITNAAAMMAKQWTGGLEKIQNMGINTVVGLEIADIGTNPSEWLRIPKLPYCLSFLENHN